MATLLRTSVPITGAAAKAGRSGTASLAPHLRTFASVTPAAPTSRSHKVVVVGGGSAGMTISHQLQRTGKFSQDDIAIVDPAEFHHYQPGWTLVGGGLKNKEDLKQPLTKLVDPKFKFYNEQVGAFSPEDNSITLSNGDKVNYEQLVVAPGINVDTSTIKGLPEALADSKSSVSTIFKYDFCDKAARNIKDFKKGTAIFTHPAGAIKCAGAPQKIMWLASDHWQRAGLYNYNDPSSSPINIRFATGLPVMFGVPKYNATLEALRQERGIDGLFQHDLIEINGDTAILARPDGGDKVTQKFDLLHAVPKMGPYAFVKNSVLADQAGYVDVDQATLRHKKYTNVWSAGDASSLPTSKTAAAITAQAPVLVNNMLRSMNGEEAEAGYDGYTSCPLLTEYGKVLLAEFKYGGVPKETFGKLGIDQGTPRRAFYYLKKDFFPWVYQHHMVKGRWGGPNGFIR